MTDAADTPAAGASADPAALDVRQAGYCVRCDRIVERLPDGSCPKGHPAAGVTGRLVLGPGDAAPVLPRFNLAAFLIPPIWGPAHGQWEGAIFLPLWLFADSTFRTAGRGGVTLAAAVIVGAGTLAAMAWFGKRANGLAWRRRWREVSVAEYVRTERVWAFAAVPLAVVLLGAALYFDLVVLPSGAL